MRSSRWLLLAAALAAASCRHDSSAPVAPVDADHDGFAAEVDCDDADPAVHAAMTAYPDADGDGVGAGATVAFCTDGSVPEGYALDGTDCAPGDGARWRAVADPPVDRDGDGYTVREGATVCAGATLPAPYRAAGRGPDCDDSDATVYRWVTLYRDGDGDGIGARPRVSPWTCAGEVIPAGFSTTGWDADDGDPSVTADPRDEAALALILD